MHAVLLVGNISNHGVALQTVAKRVCRQNLPHEKEETAQLKDGKRFPSSAVLTLLSEGIVETETRHHFASHHERSQVDWRMPTAELVHNSPAGTGYELR